MVVSFTVLDIVFCALDAGPFGTVAEGIRINKLHMLAVEPVWIMAAHNVSGTKWCIIKLRKWTNMLIWLIIKDEMQWTW